MPARSRIVPEVVKPTDKDAESLEVWGFQDTRFDINANGNAEVLGARYELSGHELPRLLPWIRSTIDIKLDPSDVNPSRYPTSIPAALKNAAFETAVRVFLRQDQMTADDRIRQRHGHGHTQQEMFAIKYGGLARVPDLVVYPEAEEQVEQLVEAAKVNNVSLIPFGGGTNVTDALRCEEQERRTIVSVDMRRMSRILWIDKENQTACIEAGAVGRNIMSQLAAHGFTMGHEPDSIEFSTLGGWIATNASGMKKNKYGNIEDLVLDLTVVGAFGRVTRGTMAPRESVGFDWRRLIFGSEGTLGIIVSAVVKLFPLPEVQRYGSLLFPNFQAGFEFVRELAREPSLPASVRLVDNLQFQFGLALKPGATGLQALKSKFEKFFVTKVKGFDGEQMVVCTLVFEGTVREVEEQQAMVKRLGDKYRGMQAGSENGRRGYQLTYGIAYIRDFLMNYYIIAESFETSAAWSDVMALIDTVKKRLQEEYAKRKLPGKPFVTARITQLYRTGAAIYFYFGFSYKGVDNPSHVYLELENIAREEILRSGGSLSHHHGVGKLRKAFLPEIMPEAALAWKREIKRGADPANVFGAGNQGL
jgi:alkyldihydroxyacetonephosphate synthase